jgi:hypothetical protein
VQAVLAARGQLDRMYELANGRPAHHNPCPVCGIRCQVRRKDKPLTTAQPLDDVSFFDAGPMTVASKPTSLSHAPEQNRPEGG